jgi:hypothetical protein
VALKGRRCWHPGHADAIRPYGTRRALSPVMQLCQVYYRTVKKTKWTGFCSILYIQLYTLQQRKSNKIKKRQELRDKSASGGYTDVP